jgi:hypothetical protein
LQRSNMETQLSTSNIFESLIDKVKRPGTTEIASRWLPKAEIIKKSTDTIIRYIERIKHDLMMEARFNPLKEEKPASAKQAVDHIFKEHNEGQLLYEKLALYKKNLLSIDPEQKFKWEISDRIAITGTDTVSEKSSFTNKYFNTTILGAITMLNKIETDIRITENRLTAFCHEQISASDWGWGWPGHTVIISQNARIVMPGDNMQILAGIGAFYMEARPIFTIAGQVIPMNAMGYAQYDFKASSNPGTHRIPIRIKYFEQIAGKDTIVEQVIEYTVKSQ